MGHEGESPAAPTSPRPSSALVDSGPENTPSCSPRSDQPPMKEQVPSEEQHKAISTQPSTSCSRSSGPEEPEHAVSIPILRTPLTMKELYIFRFLELLRLHVEPLLSQEVFCMASLIVQAQHQKTLSLSADGLKAVPQPSWQAEILVLERSVVSRKKPLTEHSQLDILTIVKCLATWLRVQGLAPYACLYDNDRDALHQNLTLLQNVRNRLAHNWEGITEAEVLSALYGLKNIVNVMEETVQEKLAPESIARLSIVQGRISRTITELMGLSSAFMKRAENRQRLDDKPIHSQSSTTLNNDAHAQPSRGLHAHLTDLSLQSFGLLLAVKLVSTLEQFVVRRVYQAQELGHLPPDSELGPAVTCLQRLCQYIRNERTHQPLRLAFQSVQPTELTKRSPSPLATSSVLDDLLSLRAELFHAQEKVEVGSTTLKPEDAKVSSLQRWLKASACIIGQFATAKHSIMSSLLPSMDEDLSCVITAAKTRKFRGEQPLKENSKDSYRHITLGTSAINSHSFSSESSSCSFQTYLYISCHPPVATEDKDAEQERSRFTERKQPDGALLSASPSPARHKVSPVLRIPLPDPPILIGRDVTVQEIEDILLPNYSKELYPRGQTQDEEDLARHPCFLRSVVLYGMPAMGKTTLATVVTKKIEASGRFSYHLWLTGSSATLLEAGLVDFARTYVAPYQISRASSVAQSLKVLRKWFAARSDWFIVADDVTPAAARILRSLLTPNMDGAQDGGGSILFTTLHSSLPSSGPDACVWPTTVWMELPALAPSSSMQLLEWVMVSDMNPHMKQSKSSKAKRKKRVEDMFQGKSKEDISLVLEAVIGNNPLGVWLLGRLLRKGEPLEAILEVVDSDRASLTSAPLELLALVRNGSDEGSTTNSGKNGGHRSAATTSSARSVLMPGRVRGIEGTVAMIMQRMEEQAIQHQRRRSPGSSDDVEGDGLVSGGETREIEPEVIQGWLAVLFVCSLLSPSGIPIELLLAITTSQQSLTLSTIAEEAEQRASSRSLLPFPLSSVQLDSAVDLAESHGLLMRRELPSQSQFAPPSVLIIMHQLTQRGVRRVLQTKWAECLMPLMESVMAGMTGPLYGWCRPQEFGDRQTFGLWYENVQNSKVGRFWRKQATSPGGTFWQGGRTQVSPPQAKGGPAEGGGAHDGALHKSVVLSREEATYGENEHPYLSSLMALAWLFAVMEEFEKAKDCLAQVIEWGDDEQQMGQALGRKLRLPSLSCQQTRNSPGHRHQGPDVGAESKLKHEEVSPAADLTIEGFRSLIGRGIPIFAVLASRAYITSRTLELDIYKACLELSQILKPLLVGGNRRLILDYCQLLLSLGTSMALNGVQIVMAQRIVSSAIELARPFSDITRPYDDFHHVMAQSLVLMSGLAAAHFLDYAKAYTFGCEARRWIEASVEVPQQDVKHAKKATIKAVTPPWISTKRTSRISVRTLPSPQLSWMSGLSDTLQVAATRSKALMAHIGDVYLYCGMAQLRLGNLDEGVVEMRTALSLALLIFPEEHKTVLVYQGYLCEGYRLAGNVKEGEELCLDALDKAKNNPSLGENSYLYGMLLSLRAAFHAEKAEFLLVHDTMVKARDLIAATRGTEHFRVADVCTWIAEALFELQRDEEARALLEDSVIPTLRRAQVIADKGFLARALSLLSNILLAQVYTMESLVDRDSGAGEVELGKWQENRTAFLKRCKELSQESLELALQPGCGNGNALLSFVFLVRGKVLYAGGEREEALAALEQGLDHLSCRSSAYRRGDVLFEMGSALCSLPVKCKEGSAGQGEVMKKPENHGNGEDDDTWDEQYGRGCKLLHEARDLYMGQLGEADRRTKAANRAIHLAMSRRRGRMDYQASFPPR